MAGTATPIYPQTVKNYIGQILPADTTTNKTIATGGTNGTRINSINISSTDTSNRTVNIYITISGTSYLLTTLSIPLSSGNAATTVPIDLLRHLQAGPLAYDANGNKELTLQANATLDMACTTTVTAAKAITAIAFGGDF